MLTMKLILCNSQAFEGIRKCNFLKENFVQELFINGNGTFVWKDRENADRERQESFLLQEKAAVCTVVIYLGVQI